MEEEYKLVFPKAKLKKQYLIGLVVTTYNRPRYLEDFFKHFNKSDLANTVVILVDDCSDDAKALAIINNFNLAPETKGVLIKAFRKTKKGFAVHLSLKFGWNYLVENFNPKYLGNLDSDTVMFPNWLARVSSFYINQENNFKPMIVSGFNCFHRKVLSKREDHQIVETLGGLNYFFNRKIYLEIILPLELYWDDRVCERVKEKEYLFIALRPSAISSEKLKLSSSFS